MLCVTHIYVICDVFEIHVSPVAPLQNVEEYQNVLECEIQSHQSGLEREESKRELKISCGHVRQLLQRTPSGRKTIKPPKCPHP